MDARLTQAETAALLPLSTTPELERARALRLAAAKACQAGLAKGVRQGLARLGDLLFGWVRRGRIRAELASLDDRELADIGLTRGDIDRVLGAAPPTGQARRRPSITVSRPG